MADNLNKFEDVHELLKMLDNTHYPSGPLRQIIKSHKALLVKDEVAAIYNLSEMHSSSLRNKTITRYEKLLQKEGNASGISTAKDNLAFDCSTLPMDISVEKMLRKIEEMPKEWTVIQMTPKYNPRDILNENCDRYFTPSVHISVFDCGKNGMQPFMVTAQGAEDSLNSYCPTGIAEELQSIIKTNKEVLTSISKHTTFRYIHEKNTYICKRQDVENRLKLLVKDMQYLWLKEWRCLLVGKYCQENLDAQVKTEIQQFFKSSVMAEELSDKNLAILCCLVKTGLHLKLQEVKKAVKFCFPNMDDNLVIKIVQFIRNQLEQLILKGTNREKHPVILVLHDSLDMFPWEMMDVLLDESVVRIPSLHFLYCLFKEHEKEIVDGYKIVTNYDKGTYIVNPGGDLKNMEVRIMTFFNYWIPQWTGTSGYLPEKEEFFELLTSSDIFSYNGHGSGSHLFSTERLQSAHVKAVVLLFGCGSTKTTRLDPQVEMFGNYFLYLIARCPCVVGMLWEVTDLDTDVLTTDFFSYWIPSEAAVHWKHFDKTNWRKANDITTDQFKIPKTSEDGKYWEPQLSRALNLAKKNLSYSFTKAACVVRGLPVKIQVISK